VIVAMEKLRVGIAGYGIVGKHRRQIIDEHPRLKTVAICDKKFEDSENPPDDVQSYTHYKQMIDAPLDILFVSLPNYLSPEVTIAGLKKGIHVFCEKPPGRTVSDIMSVLEVKRELPELKLKYGFNHRYHESVKEALGIVKSGEIGEIINLRGIYGKSKVVTFTGGWRSERKWSGGGILLDQGIHMVDLMRLFCGEFTEIKSYISNEFWKHDVEDNAYALMRDEKGRVGILHSSATQWQHRFKLDIAATKGYLELDGILSGSKSYGSETLRIGRKNDSDFGTNRDEVITYLDDNSWHDEIYEFIDAIEDDAAILQGSGEDALATMKLVYQIYCADPEWRDTFKIEMPD